MHFRELLLQYIGVLSVAASIYNPVQTRAEYGVYDVPASVGGETAKFRSIFSMPCTDCVITRAEVQLVLKGGKSAKVESGVRLHHVVFSNPSRNDSLCQARQDGERFFASGDERGLLDLRASR